MMVPRVFPKGESFARGGGFANLRFSKDHEHGQTKRFL